MATPKIIADFETQLATAIAVGGTSFTLSSATDDDGVAIPAGTYYFTVDNGSSNKEYLMGTVSGTAVTSVYSVSRQGTETSGAARAHRVGASVIITDFATYKKYMDGIALVSSPDADTATKGVSQEATQAQVDAGTATGSTSARLYTNPVTIRAKKYHDYIADAGSTDSYAITVVPAITAYSTGQFFTFKANTANTGAATLNVNSLGAKTIKKNVSTDLATGDILANQIVSVIYDGTNMQLLTNTSGTTSVLTTQVFNSGNFSKALTDANGATNVVAHGLGVTPNWVRLRGSYVSTGLVLTDGSYANSKYISLSSYGAAPAADSSTSYIVKCYSAGTADYQTATVTLDSTNITFTWAKTGTPTAAPTLYWEAAGVTTATALT